MENNLRNVLYRFVSEYVGENGGQIYSSSYDSLVKKELPSVIYEVADLERSKYLIMGGPGGGQRIPWLGVLDKSITTSPTSGVYLCYLLNQDKKKEMYLTLIQATKDQTFELLRAGAAHIRSIVGEVPFSTDLLDCGNRYYNEATACYVRYTLDEFPDEQQLLADLQLFLEIYERYVEGHLGTSDSEWWPSQEEYPLNLSKEDWKKYILEIELPEHPKPMRMLEAILELGGIASCMELSQKYGGSPDLYAGCVTNLGKRVKKYFNLPACMDGDQERYFPFPFQGKYQGRRKNNYVYRMRPELHDALKDILADVKKGRKASENMPIELNTILYGPPGTGKTYHTVLYAVSIIEGVDIETLRSEDYSEILDRYNMYKEEGLIEFTTFHQSYGYEEFIEGIKPIVTDEGQMTYSVVSGVFKRFCEKACAPKSKKAKTNANPVVWKVSLAKTGENPIRTECLKNGHVRIGWDEYGDVITEDTNFDCGGKAILNAFINEMREGDIVVSCFSESTADAIGIVSGPYSWHPEYSEYKRVRPVQWVAKGKFNITDINGGKNMTLSTVYRLNGIELDKIYAYMSEETHVVEEGRDNHVFIIDEINRGNVSKILGEAITLLEPSKRKGMDEELQVTLPYSGKKFGVPKNVYVLGTMNTADRSIALMDTALRRRFSFVEMMPDSELLAGIHVEGVSVKDLLEAINNRIHYLYDREHTIGHAYFMPLRNKENQTIHALRSVLKNKILPLLQEYFYDDYDKIAEIFGDADKKVFFKEVRASKLSIDEIKYELDYTKFDKLTAEDIKKIYQ